MKRKRTYGGTKRSRKKARRSLYRRRRRIRRRMVTSYQKQPAFSDAQIVKLRYADRVTLSGGIINYDTFSATSCYDPYVAAGGHQPMGFDQWAALYEHYIVLGAKCTIKFSMNAASSTTQNNNCICFLGLKPANTQVVTNIVTMMEQNKFKYKTLTGSTAQPFCVLKKGYSPRKYFGISNPRDDSDLRAAVTANPVENAYFEIGVGSTTGVTNHQTVEAFVLIEYLCLFTEPRCIGPS